ncbi:MAG: hypothetical protein PF961_00300 [Planctomycetota bacterium]|nr:hypothetical protein [Planctomycetota bacterium]
MVWTNWVLAVLSASMVGLIVLRRWGGRASGLGFLLMLLNPLQVWLANHHYAELMLQAWWLLVVLAYMCRASAKGVANLVVVIGLVLGLTIKIDALAGLMLGLPLMVQLRGSKRTVVARLLAGGLSCGLALWVQATAHSYVSGSLGGVLGGLGLPIGVLVVAGVVAWRCYLSRKPAIIGWTRPRSGLRFTVVVVGSLLLAFALWIRPHFGVPDSYYYWPHRMQIQSWREHTLARLAWYFSWPGLVVAWAGVLCLVYRLSWRNGVFPIVLVGVAVAALLGYDVHNNPRQPYVMRRLVPYVVPLLIIGIIVVYRFPFGHLRKWKSWVRGGLSVALVVWMSWVALGLSDHSDDEGLFAAVLSEADEHAESKMLLIEDGPAGRRVVGPLWALLDVPVYIWDARERVVGMDWPLPMTVLASRRDFAFFLPGEMVESERWTLDATSRETRADGAEAALRERRMWFVRTCLAE